MRATALVELHVPEGTLLAVPAVHFRAEFAQAVNLACGDAEHRLGAIAVELGSLTAAAAHRWLAELGAGPTQRFRLPCMLGLVKRNRFLRASVRERALELQRESGVELGRLAPSVLYEELRLASSSVLVLSPTDSIVEALRCACELDVPVYGIDLEEMAAPIYAYRVLPDPAQGAPGEADDLRHYAAVAPTDPEIDPRRELAMAARLKGLLLRHGRVLFTGGMAHWERIATHLRDAALCPSMKGLDVGDEAGAGLLHRTIIDPALAVANIDTFPAVAQVFEARRRHPRLDPPGRQRPIPRAAILRTQLRAACRRHFSMGSPGERDVAKRRDWAGRTTLERMLYGQTLLNMRAQPTLYLVDACARATVSPEFCSVLRRTFTEFPWVAPGAIPGCGVLRPALAGEGKPGECRFSENGSDSGESQVPSVVPGGASGPGAFPMPEAWREAIAVQGRSSGYRFTWRPWEDLMNALCAMAIARTQRRRRAPISEPYAGQLLEGIDVKATLRAHSRGEERIWVRDERLQRGEAPSDLPDGFPVVWIFDDDADEAGSRSWSTYFEPVEWLANFSGDTGGFRRLMRGPGDGFIDLIIYARSAPDPAPEFGEANVGLEILSGLIAFSPIFHTYRQTVSWYQVTQAARNPLTWCGGFLGREAKIRELAARMDPACQKLHWQELMIAAALPFAQATLTVVAPPGFAISPVLAQAAARRGQSISLLQTSSLPQDLMRNIVRYHVLPGRLDDHGATVYEPEAARIISEPQDCYRDLVPEAWRTFGLR